MFCPWRAFGDNGEELDMKVTADLQTDFPAVFDYIVYDVHLEEQERRVSYKLLSACDEQLKENLIQA